MCVYPPDGTKYLYPAAELCRNRRRNMAAVVYCCGITYTLFLQGSWIITKPAVLDEVFLPYNSILTPNRHLNVSSCLSSQLQFVPTVDIFQNMMKGKHLDSQLLNFFFSLDDNQNKTNEKKEKKMVSQKPHGTIEYTVSIGVWCVCACFLKVELLRLRGRHWHKTASTNSSSVCRYLDRNCPCWYLSNTTVWGELGSHPESLVNPGSLPLAAASSIFISALWFLVEQWFCYSEKYSHSAMLLKSSSSWPVLDEICFSQLEQGSSVLALLKTSVWALRSLSAFHSLPYRASLQGDVPAGNRTNA